MWHLRTRQGTFWVVESPETSKYILGVDDDELGVYTDADEAAKDVSEQSTGYFLWDCQNHVKAPAQVSNWDQGEPDNWHELS